MNESKMKAVMFDKENGTNSYRLYINGYKFRAKGWIYYLGKMFIKL